MIEQYLKGLKVPKDELTAIERNKLLNEGKDVDRIMCCIDSGETLAPLIGCTLPEYYFSAEKMCELEEYIYNKFHSDGAGLSTTLRGMAEAMGSKIKYSDYNIAQLETPAISSLDEVDKLKLINVDEDGRLPIILKGLKMVKERLGDKVPVSGTVTGPFTVASMLVGTENLLKGMVKQPDKVLQMMDIITENNNRYIQRLLDMGVGVGFADPVSSTSLLRVKQYEKFSLPFFQKNVDFIKNLKPNIIVNATGSSPLLPPIPGLHENIDKEGGKVASILNMINHVNDYPTDLTGKKVVVIGGGAVGLDVVEFFAPRGAEVSIVEMMPIIGNGIDPVSKVDMGTLMDKYHVNQMTNTALKEVREDNFLVEANGELKELPFDYGFVCLGMRAEQPILKDLRDAFEEDGSIEIVNIGDSVRARRIIEGTEEGRNIINVLKKRDYL